MDQTDHINETDQINLRDYWRIILKHRKLIITFFLVVVTTVAIYSLTMIPVYRSTTRILIERANPNILSTQEMFVINPSGQDFYQTQYKILESRALAREVIKRLNLAEHPEFKGVEEEAGIFSYFKDIQNTIISEIKGFFKFMKPSRPDFNEEKYFEKTGFIQGMESHDNSCLVNAFLGGLKVEPIRNSRLVNISFESTYPEFSARIANTLVKAYIDWNLSLKFKSRQEASKFLDDQVKAEKLKLEAAELALQQYREKYGVAIISSQVGEKAEYGQALSRQKLLTISKQVLDVKNKRIEAEIKYINALKLSKDFIKAEAIPEVINSPVIISIKQNEVDLLREKAEKSQKFGQKHPVIIALNQEIKKLRKQKYQEIINIVSAMKEKYEIALSQEHALQKTLGLSQDETISRNKIAVQYQMLQQEADSSRQLYDMLLKRFKETNVFEENRTINIHVVDYAEVPKFSVKPQLKLNLFLAVIVGLFMSVGMAFFIEYLDNTIKNPEDLERYFQLPYLGPVPHFDIKKPKTDQPDEFIIVSEPKSSASEAYRGLRTGILFSTPVQSPRSILVTSAGAGEGKTITCANLAIAMAQAGTKVVLLDCDMRKPRLHRMLGIRNEQGLSSILVGESEWRDILVSTNIPNLDFIPAGLISPNPAELIGSERMQNLINELREKYGRIIIDSSPIAAVTDPVILSRLVDGVVLVIHAGITSRDIIANGVRQLRDVHAHILGSVLNNVDIEKNSYYYYYQYYGEKDGKKEKRNN
ncbi:MAG: polysaccharide biosynthesis tyrosine autokinase [Desulfobacteraceae bacterium]|nr:polysaccharide biosynthesis tyrosine autokinase [Desulfobacteraceae bacterium]MBC2720714.1 polysaccharide biosynthesis tyrosine autokinase [Desulfobacteraceae bacterium]